MGNKEYYVTYYEEHKAERLAYFKKYYLENRERRREYFRKRYAEKKLTEPVPIVLVIKNKTKEKTDGNFLHDD